MSVVFFCFSVTTLYGKIIAYATFRSALSWRGEGSKLKRTRPHATRTQVRKKVNTSINMPHIK